MSAKGKILFVYNLRKRGAAAAAAVGERWCLERGIPAHTTPRREIELDGVELVVAIGGDGTLLRVAGAIFPREVPIFGVNVGGALGFLSVGGAEALVPALEGYAAGKYRIERRMRLSLELGERAFSALNDVVFVGPGAYRFTELSVRCRREEVLSFAGDGLVVATPTGSTAYALSAGGPLLHPEVAAMLLVPLSPHALDLRPVVLPPEGEVEVEARYPVQVFVDGDRVGRLKRGERARIARARAHTLLVRFPEQEGFFSRVRACFGG
jgi:NAD+ kinase